MDQFLDQKWVIFRVPRARARARARGDKIDFVLEMPCTLPCMGFPQNDPFWVTFWTPLIGYDSLSWSKSGPKMGHFGVPRGVRGPPTYLKASCLDLTGCVGPSNYIRSVTNWDPDHFPQVATWQKLAQNR